MESVHKRRMEAHKYLVLIMRTDSFFKSGSKMNAMFLALKHILCKLLVEMVQAITLVSTRCTDKNQDNSHLLACTQTESDSFTFFTFTFCNFVTHFENAPAMTRNTHTCF